MGCGASSGSSPSLSRNSSSFTTIPVYRPRAHAIFWRGTNTEIPDGSFPFYTSDEFRKRVVELYPRDASIEYRCEPVPLEGARDWALLDLSLKKLHVHDGHKIFLRLGEQRSMISRSVSEIT